MSSPLERLSKWLQLKVYQIEVTFSVYMFTPLEKLAFWSILFLLSSLTFLACVLYLPQHIIFITERAWFYINGENVDVAQVVKEAVVSATHAAIEHATETAAAVGQTGGLVREL